MSDLPTAELVMRVQKAREFKSRTCNAEYITPDLFGDTIDYATRNERFSNFAKRYRADETEDQKRTRALKQFRAVKLRYGGCQGITEYKRKDGSARFEVRIFTRTESYKCAVEAAIKRNRVMAKHYPGVNDVLCDLDAVFGRWGCGCGKHGRGKK